MRYTFFAVLICLLCSCGVQPYEASKSELEYASKAYSHPTTFTLTKTDAQNAWARANLFVTQYSTMKIQNATEYLIDTYNVTDPGYFGYTITRTPIGDSTMFVVKCNCGVGPKSLYNSSMHLTARADFNEHAAAYFMSTGQVMAPMVNNYWNDVKSNSYDPYK